MATQPSEENRNERDGEEKVRGKLVVAWVGKHGGVMMKQQQKKKKKKKRKAQEEKWEGHIRSLLPFCSFFI